MSLTLGLLAWALVATDGPSQSERSPIAYELRMLEMDDLQWRESCYFRLKPVGRKGGVTIWSASRATAAALQNRAATVATPPRVSAATATEVRVDATEEPCKYVAGLERQADGPVHQAASRVAYRPEVEQLREGFQAVLMGSRRPDGVLTRIELEDTRIAALHTVELTEMFVDRGRGGESFLHSEIQVPDLVTRQVRGEWLIPTGEVLVVSLGAFTAVAPDEEDVSIRERLLVVDADPQPATVALAPADRSVLPRAVPPSRSLPRAVTSDAPIALPPLPDDQVSTALFPGEPEPGPRPSLQAPAPEAVATCAAAPRLPATRPAWTPGRAVSGEAMTIDPHVAPARYEPAPIGRSTLAIDGTPLSALKPSTVRIPIGGNLAIEVRATVTPAPDDELPPPIPDN
jgi:hypothetical protein